MLEVEAVREEVVRRGPAYAVGYKAENDRVIRKGWEKSGREKLGSHTWSGLQANVVKEQLSKDQRHDSNCGIINGGVTEEDEGAP